MTDACQPLYRPSLTHPFIIPPLPRICAQLHSIAAYYPEKPTESEQGLARSLMQSIAAFYPCGYCRKDFQKSIASDPPKCVTLHPTAGWDVCLLV